MSYAEGEVMRRCRNTTSIQYQHAASLGQPFRPLYAVCSQFRCFLASAAAARPSNLHCTFFTLTRVKYAVTHLHNCRYSDPYLLPTNHSLPAAMHSLERMAKSSLDRMRRVSELHTWDGGLPWVVILCYVFY